MQRTGGGDGGVELAQRSGGGVARVGKGLAARGILAGVEGGEIGMGHVDLAPHLQQVGRTRERLRDLGDGAGIGGDVLAGLAVAAGRGHHETARLVAQAEREAVDLRLGGEGKRILGGEVQETAHPLGEIDDLRLGEGIVEAEHRAGVADLGETFRRRGADPAGGAVGAPEFGEAGLDRRVAALERIVFGIGDHRGVGLVIGAVGVGDRAREFRQFLFCRLCGQLFDGRACGHDGAPPTASDSRGPPLRPAGAVTAGCCGVVSGRGGWAGRTPGRRSKRSAAGEEEEPAAPLEMGLLDTQQVPTGVRLRPRQPVCASLRRLRDRGEHSRGPILSRCSSRPRWPRTASCATYK